MAFQTAEQKKLDAAKLAAGGVGLMKGPTSEEQKKRQQEEESRA